ncbi:MAG TPA: hypothetical protein VGC45_00090 [Gryllotalpicola sp.]
MRRRSLPALIVLAAVAGAALTGCSASNEASGCTVHSGNGSEAVTASGKFGADPEAKVPSPLNVTTTQSSTLIRGTGARVAKGGAAELAITLYDGATGAASQTQDGFFPITSQQFGSGLADAIECANEGSRIAVAVSPKGGASQLGATGSVVALVDVKKVMPDRATGHVRPATPGFPTVVLAPNGQPGIVIGSQKEPKKSATAVLKKGDGAKAKKSDAVVVQTQTVSWSDPTSATGTWENSAPTAQQLNDGSALSKALIGQTVGSQIEVLTPKAKSSDGTASVTVVDVLGVLPKS